MTRSECTHHGEADEGAGIRWDRDWMLLEPEVQMQGAGITELPLKQYLHSRRRLNHERIYFPLGYPIRVVCNSHRVLEAADQSWSDFKVMFHGEPLEFQLEVRTPAKLDNTIPPPPQHILQGSLMLQSADAGNCFIADLKRGRAMGRVTPGAVACPRYLRYFFLEAAALCMISATRAVPVHAACVRSGDKGVLLCGDSGEGKSTLAYGGARAGWTYVSDDATYIPMDREDLLAIGNCAQMRFRPSGVALFPELAGRPLPPESRRSKCGLRNGLRLNLPGRRGWITSCF